MDTPIVNALLLLLVAGAAFVKIHRCCNRNETTPEALLRNIPNGKDLRSFCIGLYARKSRLRAGTALCCLGSLAAYLGWRHFPAVWGLLCGAGVCQYLTSRLKTNLYLSLLLQSQGVSSTQKMTQYEK